MGHNTAQQNAMRRKSRHARIRNRVLGGPQDTARGRSFWGAPRRPVGAERLGDQTSGGNGSGRKPDATREIEKLRARLDAALSEKADAEHGLQRMRDEMSRLRKTLEASRQQAAQLEEGRLEAANRSSKGVLGESRLRSEESNASPPGQRERTERMRSAPRLRRKAKALAVKVRQQGRELRRLARLQDKLDDAERRIASLEAERKELARRTPEETVETLERELETERATRASAEQERDAYWAELEGVRVDLTGAVERLNALEQENERLSETASRVSEAIAVDDDYHGETSLDDNAVVPANRSLVDPAGRADAGAREMYALYMRFRNGAANTSSAAGQPAGPLD